MGRLLRDVTYAWRTLRKTPVFTAVAILTLALGVGANSAIFSLISAVLLRPLPFPQPERLAFVWEETTMFGLKDSVVSLANYVDWRERSRSFQTMGALEGSPFTLTGAGEPLVLDGASVTASALGALGVQPALGRAFREEEDRSGAKTVILSDGLWRRLYGADRTAIGRSINLNGAPHTIVGVMPPSFRFPYRDTELWVPVGARYAANEFSNRGRHNWMVVGRLAHGVTLERANSEIAGIGKHLEQEYPDTNRNVGAFVAPMREHFVGDSRTVLVVLSGAVGFILLIACVNIANLLLARAGNRKREIAIRTAIGAERRQLMWQLLTENLLLALFGGACGLGLAFWTLRFLEKLVPDGIAGLTQVSVDGRVLAFTLAVSIATGIVFGLIPAFRTTRVDLHQVLKQGGGRQSTGRGARGLERALVVAEVALAFVLTAGAALMIQAFVHLRNADPGFRTNHLLTIRTSMPKRLFIDDGRRNAFLDESLRRVRALPGVISAGFTLGVPIAFKGWVNGFEIEGQRALAEEQFSNSNFRVITPDYLSTLGVPLRRGRGLDVRDRPDAPLVTVVNEAFERKFWPAGPSAVGKRLRFGDTRPWVTIVGVVGDIRQTGLDVPSRPEMYLPAAQAPFPTDWLAVRTAGDPASLAGAVRRELRAVDKDLPIRDVSTMEQILDRETFDRRVEALLLAIFAALAVLLASVGIYGVLAYMVAQRTGEIGIRVALGAKPADVLVTVAGQGMALSAAGIAIGTVAALAVTRLLTKLLFGISATDPATFAGVALLLLAVAGLASYLPARRAMRVDPILALREE